jgi:protein O-mannosyl-transferase
LEINREKSESQRWTRSACDEHLIFETEGLASILDPSLCRDTMQPNSSPRTSHYAPVILTACLLVLSGLLAYQNTFSSPFLFDDLLAITGNRSIEHLRSLPDVFVPQPGTGSPAEGRPIFNLTLAINYAVGRHSVHSYHSVNLAIHLLAGLVVFGIIGRTLRLPRLQGRFGPHASSIAALVAALWILHPLQTESVTYIAQRAESLMGLFYLLTLYGFIRAQGSIRSTQWLTLSASSCFLGMATKEVMVTAPVVLFIYDRVFISGSYKSAWQRHRHFYSAVAISWLLLGGLVWGSGNRGGTIGPSAGVTWWQYALCQSRAVVHYIALSVWPHPLIFDYGADFVTLRQVAGYLFVDGVVLVSIITGLVRGSTVAFLGAWLLIILSPTSSVIGGTRQMLAEHRMYLPILAVAVFLVTLLFLVLGRRIFPWAACAAVALLFATYARNNSYRSEVSIWNDTTAKRPRHPGAHDALGLAILRTGDPQHAIPHFERALQLDPARVEAHVNMASAYLALNRPAEALQHSSTAVRLAPESPEAHNDQALALVALGQDSPAIGEFEAALRINPNLASAHYNLGHLWLRHGQPAGAIQYFQRALAVEPNYVEPRIGLGIAYAKLERFPEAIVQLKIALSLSPNSTLVQQNLANVLRAAASSPLRTAR